MVEYQVQHGPQTVQYQTNKMICRTKISLTISLRILIITTESALDGTADRIPSRVEV